MLKVANHFVSKEEEKQSLTAMFISSTNEINPYKIEEYEKKVSGPIWKEADKLNRKIDTIFKASNDIDADVVEVIKKR